MKKIIDISYWQRFISWDAVVEAGISGVIIKASDGITADLQAPIHLRNAKDKNLPSSFYHFAHPASTPNVAAHATSEAKTFCDAIDNLAPADDYVALDLEVNTNNLSKDDLELWVQSFRGYMKGQGYEIMLYAGPGFLNANLNADHSLGDMPLWLAEYNGQEAPTVYPNGWSECILWQYTDKLNIGGTNCDCSVVMGEYFPDIS